MSSVSDVKLFGRRTKNLKPVVVDGSGISSRYQHIGPIYDTYEKSKYSFEIWLDNKYSFGILNQ